MSRLNHPSQLAGATTDTRINQSEGTASGGDTRCRSFAPMTRGLISLPVVVPLRVSCRSMRMDDRNEGAGCGSKEAGARDGASHGIGQATALALAREGADVAITWRSREEGAAKQPAQIEELGRRSTAIQPEVTNRDDCTRLVEEALAGSRLDILVNNAGGGRSGPLIDQAPENWDTRWRSASRRHS